MRTRTDSGTEERDTVAGRARRAQIERAAVEVLSEVGYPAASVGRIAQRAGISKGVITYHFASKDDLLRRVALTLFEGCAAHVAAAVSDEMTPALRLGAQLSAEMEFFSTRRTEFLAMAEVMSNHREPDFIRSFEHASTDEAEVFADLLRQGQQQGQFRDFDVDDVACLIDAAKNGVLDVWASDENRDLMSLTQTMLDFVDHAVRA